MQLLVKKTDGTILFIEPESTPIRLLESHVEVGEVKVFGGCNQSTCQVVQVDSVPEYVRPHHFAYVGGSFQPTTAGTEALEAQVAEVLESRKREVDALRDAKIHAGFRYTFPDGTTGTAQVRNPQDVVTIIGLGVSGLELVSAGDTTATIPFRDAENKLHEMTWTELLNFGRAFRTWWKNMYATGWQHKDQLEAIAGNVNLSPLERLSELQSYDISSGWPIA